MRPPDRSSHAPRSIGGYPLLRTLGVGGMSEVFLGYDPDALRPVAVKVLADHLAGDQQFVNRFYREAVLSRTLSHPSLIRGLNHGYDADAGKHFLALEYVDGPTAHSALERIGRFPPAVAVRLTLDVATALAYLHANRYVHRDVKPDNLLLPSERPIKLADLGLTKRIATDGGHLTTHAQGFGTPHYMPYEQVVNAALVDERSDIFALGATLYHLTTGRVPFPDSEANPSAPRGPVVPAGSVCDGVPACLDSAIGRMLAADPRERFQSMDELIPALEQCGPFGTPDQYSEVIDRVRQTADTGDEAGGDAPTRLAVLGTAASA